jgi:hypothetical protein
VCTNYFNQADTIHLPLGCCLNVAERSACSDHLEQVRSHALHSVRSRRQTENSPWGARRKIVPGPLGWKLGDRLTTTPRKIMGIRKPSDRFRMESSEKRLRKSGIVYESWKWRDGGKREITRKNGFLSERRPRFIEPRSKCYCIQYIGLLQVSFELLLESWMFQNT